MKTVINAIRRLRPHLTYANVTVTLLALVVLTGGVAYAANTIRSTDIIDGEVKTNDLAANAVVSGKIADQQVKNVDLGLGASSSNTIADGGVQGIDVKDNTLKGADIDESSLGQVPAAQNAATLGGSYVWELQPGRIHAIGDTGVTPLNGALEYAVTCAEDNMHVTFFPHESAYTMNAMSVSSGVEGPIFGGGTDIGLANGAQDHGFPGNSNQNFPSVYLANTSGSARGEIQIILDAGTRTYTLAMHMFIRASDGYCEALGTALLAQ